LLEAVVLVEYRGDTEGT